MTTMRTAAPPISGAWLRNTVFILLILILSCSVMWFHLRVTRTYGAGLSPDSVVYISVARNILHGNGIFTFDGTPLVLQPPLFPISIAAVSRLLNTDPLEGVRILNGTLLGVVVVLGSLLAYLVLRSRLYAFGVAVLLASSHVLLEVSVMAWSEPLFIVLVLVFLVCCLRPYRQNLHGWAVLMGLLVACATLTRYLGVVLLPVGGVVIALWPGSRRNRLARLLLFAGCAVVPIAIWLTRNLRLTNTLMGPRAPSSFTFQENLRYVINTLLDWFVPHRIASEPKLMISFTVAMVLFIGYSLSRRPDVWSKALRVQQPVLLFVLAYIVTLLITSTTTAYDAIGTRLLSPIYVPMVLLIVGLLDSLLASIGLNIFLRPKRFHAIALPIMLVMATYMMVGTVNFGRYFASTGGPGYNNVASQGSNCVIEWLRHHPKLVETGPLYSYDPFAIYILTGYRAQYSPAKRYYNSPKEATALSALEGSWPPGDALLVMFSEVPPSWLYSRAELQTIADFRLLYQCPDGQVFQVTSKGGT